MFWRGVWPNAVLTLFRTLPSKTKKTDQARAVFDSSAEYQGKSLNRELLTGPYLMNNLFGVLIRFFGQDVEAMCDVEQMF